MIEERTVGDRGKTQWSCRTAAAVKHADALLVRKLTEAIPRGDFGPGDPDLPSNPRRCMPALTVDGITR